MKLDTGRMARSGINFVVLVLFFLFSFTLNAQHYPVLVGDAVATELIAGELPGLSAAFEALPDGTPAKAEAGRKLNLFTHAWEELVNGKSVSEALNAAYIEYAAGPSGNSLNEDELVAHEMEEGVLNYGDIAFNQLVELVAD